VAGGRHQAALLVPVAGCLLHLEAGSVRGGGRPNGAAAISKTALPPHSLTLRQAAIPAVVGRRAVAPLAWAGSEVLASFWTRLAGLCGR
jgi:hypothetical protein